MNKFIQIFLFLAVFFASLMKAEAKVYEMLPEMPENPLSEQVVVKKYDYTNTTRVPIYLKIEDTYKTSGDTQTGDELTFVATRDVIYNDKILVKKGEKTTARIRYFIRRGMNGIPSILILDGFNFANLDERKLDAHYMKRGIDNTLLVLPLKWALTILYPLGSFTNFIIGGEARISSKKEIVLYYYPEWILE